MPKTGRPPKKGESKTVNIQFRITQTTDYKLKQCAESLNKSRNEIVEQGIDIIYDSLKK